MTQEMYIFLISWWLVGAISWIVLCKIANGLVVVKDILYVLFIGFSGLTSTFCLISYLHDNGYFKFPSIARLLNKKLW